MLDAETRLTIAPLLATFRRTGGELQADRLRLAEVAATMKAHLPGDEPTTSGWRRGGAAARQLRDLQNDHEKLTVAISAQEAFAEEVAEQIDRVLHPVLRRADGYYQRVLATSLLFGEAAGFGEAALGHLDAAAQAAHAMTRALMARTATASGHLQADLAAQRYTDHMRRAGSALRALPGQVAEIERKASVLARVVFPPVPMPDLERFEALPGSLTDAGARLRLAHSLGGLRVLENQVRNTTTEIGRRRDLADKKRRTALRAAYARL